MFDPSGFFQADYSLLLEQEMMIRLLVQVELFLASAFFSGSETALFALSRVDLRRLQRERSPHAGLLHRLLDQPRRLIIAILCGNEIVNIAAAANMTAILVSLYGVDRGAIISVAVMVPLLLLFGEATPKTLAVSNPVRVSSRVARPITIWVRLMTPFTWVIRIVADRMTTLVVGEEKAVEHLLRPDEFRTLVEEGVVTGDLSATESALIHNLLRGGAIEVVEIMTSRTQIHFIDAHAPMLDAIQHFAATRHKRVPVYRGHRDNVVGILHAEDVLRFVLDPIDLAAASIDDILRPPAVVPPTKKIDEMFDYFQQHNVQAALVINEFGGVDGFITLNDVLAFTLGEPQFDQSAPEVAIDRDAEVYELPGDIRLVDFNSLTGFNLVDSRMTSLGGVVFRQLDRLPRVGDCVELQDICLEIIEMAGHRVARVRASRVRGDQAVADTSNCRGTVE